MEPHTWTFAILAAALVLFAGGWWRYDLVALLALLTLALAGVVPADAAFDGFGHSAVVTVAVAMLLSNVINNAAAAVIMVPIAVEVASRVGVAADAHLMAVAIGASCAFLTRIGHQSNTLVLGPGGFRFADYWRLGLPLSLIVTLVAVPLLLLVWAPGPAPVG